MRVGEIVEKWEMNGMKSIQSFNLSNHYTILYDDKDEGFSHLFDELGVDKTTLLNSTNSTLIKLFNEIDDDMREVSVLIECFIKNVLWKHTVPEEVVNQVEVLRSDIERVFEKTHTTLQTIKTHLEEGILDATVQAIH